MPRGDRSGPNGMGPMSGRGAGFCNGANSPGYMNGGGYNVGFRRGFGRGFNGFGRGAGFAPSYVTPVYSKESEKGYLESEASYLKEQLKRLEDRLAHMQEDE